MDCREILFYYLKFNTGGDILMEFLDRILMESVTAKFL